MREDAGEEEGPERREENKGKKSMGVFHMRMHLDGWGSALVAGDRFSISCRQSSNTLAGGRRKGIVRRCVIGGGEMRVRLTNVCICLCTCFYEFCMDRLCECAGFIGCDLSGSAVRKAAMWVTGGGSVW